MTLSDKNRLQRFQDGLGYRFKNEAELRQALTHRSFKAAHYERQEFLGDAVLELAISDYLYRAFPDLDEGRLSRFRAQIVRKESLATKARKLDFGPHLLLGHGERSSGGFDRDSILADAFEAVLGAIYLEAGFDCAKMCVLQWFTEELAQLNTDQISKDPKTRLQELLQARGLALPQYQLTAVSGNDHQQQFQVDCSCSLVSDPVSADGDSIKQAEQKAAQMMLEQLHEN